MSNTPRIWSEPPDPPESPPLQPEQAHAPLPASATADRPWGWLIAVGGAAFAAGAFLPWVSLGSGAITLTLTGMQMNGMQGIYQNHASVVIAGGSILAVLGLLIAGGVEARIPVFITAGLGVAWTVWEFTNVNAGQDRVIGGAVVSIGAGLFVMLAGSGAALAGVLIPEMNHASAKPRS